MHRAVDQLVDDGAVLRMADPDDRRAVALTLTPKGKKLHREFERALDAQIAAVFSRLGAADRARVSVALQKLLSAYSDFELDDLNALTVGSTTKRPRRGTGAGKHGPP